MAFSRKALKAMGLTEEQIDSLVELHSESLEGLKAERDTYKKEAEKLAEVQEKLDTATADLDNFKKDDYKAKYETEKAAFEKYKGEIEEKETSSKKTEALKSYLKEQGYSAKGIDKISKYGGYVASLELDENGGIKSADQLAKTIESEWGEYKSNQGNSAYEPTAADGNGNSSFSSMSLADMMKFANDNPNSDDVTSWLKNPTIPTQGGNKE